VLRAFRRVAQTGQSVPDSFRRANTALRSSHAWVFAFLLREVRDTGLPPCRRMPMCSCQAQAQLSRLTERESADPSIAGLAPTSARSDFRGGGIPALLHALPPQPGPAAGLNPLQLQPNSALPQLRTAADHQKSPSLAYSLLTSTAPPTDVKSPSPIPRRRRSVLQRYRP
jgi:hypothetical protein